MERLLNKRLSRRDFLRVGTVAGAGIVVEQIARSSVGRALGLSRGREECRFVDAVVREGKAPGYHRHECVFECIKYDENGKPIAASMEPASGKCKR